MWIALCECLHAQACVCGMCVVCVCGVCAWCVHDVCVCVCVCVHACVRVCVRVHALSLFLLSASQVLSSNCAVRYKLFHRGFAH